MEFLQPLGLRVSRPELVGSNTEEKNAILDPSRVRGRILELIESQQRQRVDSTGEKRCGAAPVPWQARRKPFSRFDSERTTAIQPHSERLDYGRQSVAQTGADRPLHPNAGFSMPLRERKQRKKAGVSGRVEVVRESFRHFHDERK